jgi:hypothetical protein
MMTRTHIQELFFARYGTGGRNRCRINEVREVPAGQIVLFTRWYEGVFPGNPDVSENRCAYIRSRDRQLVFDMITE